MTRTKIAVSLPAELVAAAKLAVRSGKAASVSGYVETALATQVENDDLNAWVEQLLTDAGPLSDEDWAWAKEALGQ